MQSNLDADIDPSLDSRVAALARRQHGLFTVTQLRHLGVTRSQMRTRVGTGRWTGAGPSVLRINGAPDTWEAGLMSAVLSAGPAAVVSHRAAAGLWGLEAFRGCPAEVSIPRTRALGRRRDVEVHRSGDLHLVEPAVRSAMPVTPVARTLLDLGGVAGRTELRRAVEEARRKGLVGWGDLLDVLVTHARRGRNGVAPLRGVLDDRADDVAGAGRALERLVAALLTRASLPPPVVGHPVDGGDGPAGEVAVAYPAARVALDIPGPGVRVDPTGGRDVTRRRDRHHGGWPPQPRSEAAAVLGHRGWQVLHVDWHDYLRGPGRIVRRVREALDRAGA